MKTSRTWNFRSIAGKMMTGLVLAVMIGSIAVAPAFGKNDHKQMGKHHNGRYEHRGRGYDDRNHRHVQSRPVYRSYNYYGYRERVYYPPPPVVYEPPPPPGIGIFFPPLFIRIH
jgi:hypothetical protein